MCIFFLFLEKFWTFSKFFYKSCNWTRTDNTKITNSADNIDPYYCNTRFQFQLSMCETSMIGKLQHGFLILVHVCFTFWKYVTIIECLCKYSNHCLFFWIGNVFLFLLSTYLGNTGSNIILYEDVIVRIEVTCTN